MVKQNGARMCASFLENMIYATLGSHHGKPEESANLGCRRQSCGQHKESRASESRGRGNVRSSGLFFCKERGGDQRCTRLHIRHFVAWWPRCCPLETKDCGHHNGVCASTTAPLQNGHVIGMPRAVSKRRLMPAQQDGAIPSSPPAISPELSEPRIP